MDLDSAKPLIVQSDRTLLLDVHTAAAGEARAAILPFAELEKSPEHIHTYRITPLSLWNAASAGISPAGIVKIISAYSRYAIPAGILEGFTDIMSRYGKIRMVLPDAASGETGDTLFLYCEDELIAKEIEAARSLGKYLRPREGPLPDGAGGVFSLRLIDRGTVKLELIHLGWPVKDEAPFAKGEELNLELREISRAGRPFAPRDYQWDAAHSVCGDGGPGTGYGVVVLPCGSGKTVVGMTVMSLLKTNTLILTTNVAAVHQWIEELLDKTSLEPESIAEYTGDSKSVAPVTIATYQIITWRPDREGDFPHFHLFRERPWGLIIYDEVHLLPAPVFRVTAELQAVRRLGLTATLIREDGAEDAVFSLVGPKRCDVPWKDLEIQGWIAEAICTEIRLDLPEDLRIPYAVASPREKYRIASENPFKEDAARQLVENHPEDHILIIGQYISQLESVARLLKAPLITGKMANPERERIYAAFKRGELRVIVVSRVANFAIDLPDASCAVQISGSFGSRQEEAQRLGRILRPKGGKNVWFYTLVSHSTVEEDFAGNRQKFLAEQGYKYSIQHWTA
ncbi:MAG: DEAD/DEAH box helicase [Treponema sp.]|jgi:DNA excision repair protein ERCC-3|nr:DEAD/DEAH box helicase [Treponema sp.]